MDSMSTTDLIGLLKREGYIVNYEYIRFLLRNYYIDIPKKINNAWKWSDDNVDELRSVLSKRGRKKKDCEK